ncbi:MAG: YdcF family protein [Clostridia bacterium]|nr:YdcF family protein [Clostridia bacterium]
MKGFWKKLSALLVPMLLIALPGCGESAAPNETADAGSSPRAIVEKMAVAYGAHGEQASSHVEEYLTELKKIDPAAGERWERIMALWSSPDLGKPLHYNVLPDGLPDTDELCIVVLGFQLEPDGSMREELVQRLKVALVSAEKYPNALIVCTGGGTAAENEDASEAGEMAKWLIREGIDRERVIVEDHSISTAQNALFTYDILTSLYPRVKHLAIVSSDYHIATGELLFRAESILRASGRGEEKLKVVANAAWQAPSGELSPMFQAGALIELFGDVQTAFEIYYDNYEIHDLPQLK